MYKRDWLILFDETNEKFKWFFIDYGFQNQWNELLIARDHEWEGRMRSIMNDVWFTLPSSKFNIRVNPPGWNEFLTLLEE